jgi:hypothetical protein
LFVPPQVTAVDEPHYYLGPVALNLRLRLIPSGGLLTCVFWESWRWAPRWVAAPFSGRKLLKTQAQMVGLSKEQVLACVVIGWNFGHHFFKCGTHDLDKLWIHDQG